MQHRNDRPVSATGQGAGPGFTGNRSDTVFPVRQLPAEDGAFPPLPPRLPAARKAPPAEHHLLLRTPGPALPAPAAFRQSDRDRPAAAPSAELRAEIERAFAQSCAWLRRTPGADDLVDALRGERTPTRAAVLEAWILEAPPRLWLQAWRERLYDLEELVGAAQRLRLEHRLFRHVMATYAGPGGEPAATHGSRTHGAG